MNILNANKFFIQGSDLYYKDYVLGNKDLLHVDYNELVGVTEKVEHHTMPERVDMVFTAGSVVCGVESKTPDDLLNSFLTRRLKRQLRTLLTTVDRPVLLIRGEWPTWLNTKDKKGNTVTWCYDKQPSQEWRCGGGEYYVSLNPIWEELARWQMLGGVVLNGPESDSDVPEYLEGMKKILSGSRNVLVAISGTDKNKEKENRPGWLLRRIQGIGNKSSVMLHEQAGTTLHVLRASGKQLKEWGANKRQVKAIQEAVE